MVLSRTYKCDQVEFVQRHNFNASKDRAVGRLHRLDQKKPSFAHRFRCGGTYKAVINKKAVFEDQLLQRAVDKKDPTRHEARLVD